MTEGLRQTVTRRRAIELMGGAFVAGGVVATGGPFIAAWFGENGKKNALEAERQQRIRKYVASVPSLEKLERDSKLIGGVWVKPLDQVTTVSSSGKLRVAARAYAPQDGVKHVVFTADYPNRKSPDPAHPDAWDILDVIDQPDKDGVYVLPEFNYTDLGLKRGYEVRLSFDVVNTRNQIKYAPEGIHFLNVE